MASLAEVLGLIRQNESGGNYGKTPQENYRYPASHASGAYQFQPGTWRQWTAASGIGTEYKEAYKAPATVQDAVAAYAAVHGPGVNSEALWGRSAPAGGYPDITEADMTSGLMSAGPGSFSPGTPGGSLLEKLNPVPDIATAFQEWGKNFLGGIENWFVRFGLILAGIVLLAIGVFLLSGNTATKLATTAAKAAA